MSTIEIYELKLKQLKDEIETRKKIDNHILEVITELCNVYDTLQQPESVVNTLIIVGVEDLVIENGGIQRVPVSMILRDCTLKITNELIIKEVPYLEFKECKFLTENRLYIKSKMVKIDSCTLYSNLILHSHSTALQEVSIENLIENDSNKYNVEIRHAEKVVISNVVRGKFKYILDAKDIVIKNVVAESFSILALAYKDVSLNISKSKFNNIEFKNVGFKVNSSISDSEILDCNLDACDFKGYFAFINNVFHKAPIFAFDKDKKYPNNLTFQRSKFRDYTEDAAGRYRLLKDIMASANNELEETRFAGLEMKSRDKTLTWWSKDFFEKFCSQCAWLFNDYGISIFRPLLVLFMLVILGTLIFYKFPELITQTPDISGISNTWANSIYNSNKYWVQASYYSIINCLGPVKLFLNANLITAKNIWGQLFAVSQGIISSILWYLLIVGIKKRFRQH